MPKQINSRLAASASDKVWRFEAMFHLGVMSVDESLPTVLKDALGEEMPEIAAAIGVPVKRRANMECDEFWDFVRDNGTTGFLAQVATPVRTYFDDNTDSDSFQFSWGHYSTEWLYADTLETLLPKIESWVAERGTEDRSRSKRRAA